MRFPSASSLLRPCAYAGVRAGSRALSGDAKALAAARAAYAERLQVLGDDYDGEAAFDIERLKLGRRHGCYNQKTVSMRRNHACNAIQTGAAHDPAELPSHALPEVALCGCSNSGKSSLLNAMCGIKPAHGAASVSAKAGWTRSLQLYQLSEASSEPLMGVVDCPGYGAADATATARQRWARAVRRYLRERQELVCAFVLIESSLGVTAEDEAFMSTLDAVGRPFHVVMTKADLLSPLQLAQSHALVSRQVATHGSYSGSDVPMCSALNATGVPELWHRLRAGVMHHAAAASEAPSSHDDATTTTTGARQDRGVPSSGGTRQRRRVRRLRADTST